MPNDGHIRLLPTQVANKIAAGEVVERPASVVKELLENAVDAGATRITVRITAGGRKLVAVRDDGCGMGRDDALMSLERQATSKIRDVDDIERISTLGFRGEAIPSIASVSRFTLVTRRSGDDAGTRVQVDAGRVAGVGDAGCPPGTQVEVRDLFCNVPARRKFLRTVATEENHVRAVFTVHALAHPEIGFTLEIDGREAYRLPSGSTLPERIADLFGPDFTAVMNPVDSGAGGPVRVHGFLERPNRSDPVARRDQFVFVNGRPATAPVIAYAVKEAYPRQSGDARPAAVLFIDLPPDQVDVNVHPAKREVRFRHPGDVRDAIIAACSPCVARPPAPAPAPMAPAAPAPALTTPAPAPAPAPFAVPFSTLPAQRPPFVSSAPLQPGLRLEPAPAPADAPAPSAVDAPRSAPAATGLWRWFRFLAITESGYLLLETDAGLVTVNPVAAMERVAFEELMDADEVVSQPLLIPKTVRMSPIQFARVKSFLDVVRSMGFQIEEFGPDTWKVDAEPQLLGDTDVALVLDAIAVDAAQAGAKRGADWRAETIARAVARSFAGASPRVTPEGAVKLMERLALARQPYVCPRGKPVMIFTSNRELERKFTR